jgi:plasmid stabilization system protein ParE
MRKLDWTAPALHDLDAINAWLSEEADPFTALRMLKAIRTRSAFLQDFPRGGPPMRDEDSRSLRVTGTPYSLLYRILEDESVQILRVHHARQDWRGA